MVDMVVAQRVPIFVRGKCSVARGVTDADLKPKDAQFVNPKSSRRRSPRPIRSYRAEASWSKSRHDDNG